jgi:FtsH-binding integral membrane protein
MTTTLFGTIILAYGLITLYFCWRFYLRRRLPSLVCALMPVGWIVAFGLQLNHIGPEWLPVLFILSLCIAGLSITIIVHHELQRDYPFR